MKIKLISIGKEEEDFILEGIKNYEKRLKHYCSLENIHLKPPKENTTEKQKEAEAKLVLSKLKDDDVLILFDERGKEFTSEKFANFLQQKMNNGTKCLCFVIGGAYGFGELLYKKTTLQIALSQLTFPHQLAKLIFTEQLYRAFTILKNEKYHH